MPDLERFAVVRAAAVTALLLSTALPGAARAAGGFESFYNLEYDDAISFFRQEIAAAPGLPDAYNHLAQAILYRGLYRSGIMENSLVSGNDFLLSLIYQPKLVLDPAADREFQRAVAAAIDASQALLRGNPNDARALYSLGAAYALRANYDFLVRKAWISALRESTTARKLHNRVAAMDSSNVDARMIQAVQDYIVASLPGPLRFMGAIVGIHGDKEAGLAALETVAAQGSVYRTDAAIVLATLYRHEDRPAAAMGKLARLRQDYPRNYLFHFAEIYTYIEMKDERAASGSLRSLARLQSEGAPGYAAVQSARLQYAGGVIECRFGHLDRALQSMNWLASSPGVADTQTRLMAMQRLGMIHDIRGERANALRAYQQVVDAAPGTPIARETEKYINHPFHGCNTTNTTD